MPASTPELLEQANLKHDQVIVLLTANNQKIDQTNIYLANIQSSLNGNPLDPADVVPLLDVGMFAIGVILAQPLFWFFVRIFRG